MTLAIAHILSSFGIGGQERVALDLASAHREGGHAVLAVSLAAGPDGPMAEKFLAAGVPIARLPTGGRLTPSLALRLAELFRQHGTAVVHTHNPQPLIYGSVAGRLARAAVVHTKHGRNPGPRRRLWLRRIAGRLADAFVAVSEVTADQARQDRDCADSRLCVVRNGIDVSAYGRDETVRAAVRAELGIPGDAWVIGTVGRIDQNKNHALLIAAARPLLERGAHLVIVGDGDRRSDAERAAADTGMAHRIHLTGMRSDIPRLYSAFDLFALSSDTEGLPLVVPEAMASELPVVSTAVGGVPSVVRAGQTGLLVPAGDRDALSAALAELAGDRARAAAMGAAGRALAHRDYSRARMASDYLRIYERALGGRGRS